MKQESTCHMWILWFTMGTSIQFLLLQLHADKHAVIRFKEGVKRREG